ncbi:hypothetical protein ACFVWF_28870 [Rhodococcus qingshengii]
MPDSDADDRATCTDVVIEDYADMVIDRRSMESMNEAVHLRD